MAKSERIRTVAGMVPELPPVLPLVDGRLTSQQIADITDSIRNLIRAVNGRLSFGDGSNSSQSGNVDGQLKTVKFVAANTDYEVPHGLGRIPIGIVVLSTDADAAVVRGSSQGSWGKTRLFVRCNIAGTTALFVVV